MKPPDRPARRLAELSVCTALLLAVQVAMAPLPNIELVSLLILLDTRVFRRQALLIVYAFVLLEGLIYGFQLWWIAYLYVWTVWWATVTVFNRRQRPVLQWALLCGAFGLLFGGLCALLYLFFGGPAAAFGWWVAGIPMDLLHGAGNFTLTLILFRPLSSALDRVCPAA